MAHTKDHKEPFLDQPANYVYQPYPQPVHQGYVIQQPPPPGTSYGYGAPQTQPGQAVYYNAYVSYTRWSILLF